MGGRDRVYALRDRANSLRVVLPLTIALLVLPVIVDIAPSPKRRIFGYLAADTFYYLTVARNIARHGVPTYDGVHATNGFHPLWEGICALSEFVTLHLGIERYTVLLIALLGLALIAGAVALLALAFDNARALHVGFLGLPLGASALATSALWRNHCLSLTEADPWNVAMGRIPLFGTLWSYANGMESGILLFCFGALAYAFTKAPRAPSTRGAAAFGGLAALFTFARLDHALVVLPVLIAFVWHSCGRARTAAFTAFGAPLALYLGLNRLLVGVALPLSGAAKTTFPYFSSDNLRHLFELGPAATCLDVLVFSWREAGLLVPVAFAVVYLVSTLQVRARTNGETDALIITMRPSAGDIDRFLVPVATGVLLLGAYNFLFVVIVAQGPWYFPVSTTFATLSILALVVRVRRAPDWLSAAVPPAIIAVSLGTFVGLNRTAEFNARLASFFWDEGPRVRAHYTTGEPRFVEFDDGIVSYSIDAPATSGMLMLDPQGEIARESGKLLPLAKGRGFDHVATFVYGFGLADQLGNPAEWARRITQGQDTSGFDFAFDYVSPAKDFAILSMKLKAP